MILRNIVSALLKQWRRRSGESYLRYLRKCGVKIGSHCIIRDPRSTFIDVSRPSLVTIGDNVDMNRNFELLTHDWASHVFVRKYNDFIPAHRRVEIGSNIYFGTKCVVLPGSKIGDNCVIGAFSLVNKEIPPNSVAAGIPARVICSIDDYYRKRISLYAEEVTDYAKSIQERFNRKPEVSDFYNDYPAFVDRENFEEYADIPYDRIFTKEQLSVWKKHHKAPFGGFEEFLEKAGIKP